MSSCSSISSFFLKTLIEDLESCPNGEERHAKIEDLYRRMLDKMHRTDILHLQKLVHSYNESSEIIGDIKSLIDRVKQECRNKTEEEEKAPQAKIVRKPIVLNDLIKELKESTLDQGKQNKKIEEKILNLSGAHLNRLFRESKAYKGETPVDNEAAEKLKQLILRCKLKYNEQVSMMQNVWDQLQSAQIAEAVAVLEGISHIRSAPLPAGKGAHHLSFRTSF